MVNKIPQAILDIPIPKTAEDYSYLPVVRNKKDVANILKPMYVIHECMADKDEYDDLMETIYEILMASYEIPECRDYPIKFKFYSFDKELYTLPLRHFMVNLAFWRPLIEVHSWTNIMNEEFIFDCSNSVNKKKFRSYLNDYPVRVLIDHNIKTDVMNKEIAETLHWITTIATDFSNIIGLTFGLETFIDMYNKYPEYRELMATSYPNTMQPVEIEAEQKKRTEQVIKLFQNDPGNPIGKIFSTGTGINAKQFWEFTGNAGLNPDIYGKTIPRPINTNTLMGITKNSDFCISAMGARKSQIMNKKVMGNAGYFGKIVLLLALTLPLSRVRHDCGSKLLVPKYIPDKNVLEKYNGRYYKTSDPNSHLKVLKAKTDSHLVGTTIYLRSPMTCCNGFSDGVCHVCYGKNTMLALDIAEGASGFGSQEITKVVNQMILSAKHLLSTISETVKFNPEFDTFFTLESDQIIPNLGEDAPNDINIEDWGIYIDPDDIRMTDEMDDMTCYNTCISSGKFYVKNVKTGEMITISAAGAKELYPTDTVIELMHKGKGENKGLIMFKDLEENTCVFTIDIMNNELTKPLYEIMNVLNKERDKDYTIPEILDYFCDLLIRAGINAHSLQAELILSTLIRDPDNIMERPDFSGNKMPKYTILTVNQAINNCASPIVGLAFQNIRKQLLSDATFYEKHAASYMDDFYRTRIRMKPSNSWAST